MIARLCSLFVFVSIGVVSKETYETFELLQVVPKTEEQVKFLNKLEFATTARFNLDFWTHVGDVGDPVEIFVGPADLAKFKRKLTNRGITFAVLDSQIEQNMQPDQDRLLNNGLIDAVASNLSFDSYNRYEQIENYLVGLASTFPDLVSVQSIGKTHELRDIWLVTLSTNSTTVAKPAIYIDGGTHAREWISPSTVLYMLNQLTTGYASDAEIRSLVDSVDWHIIPLLNPDGYEFTHTDERLWRKNRRPAATNCVRRGKCCDGVDLNRNFDWHWGEKGSKKKSCSILYRGIAPFSEPETAAVRDFLMANKDTLKAFLSVHSYGELWLYPYGHHKRALPDDWRELAELAQIGVDAIKTVNGNKYKVGNAAKILYKVAGAAKDYAKGVVGIKFAYLLELTSGRFVIDEAEIIPTGEEAFAGIKAFANELARRFPV